MEYEIHVGKRRGGWEGREGRKICGEKGGSNSGVPHRLTLRPHTTNTNRFPNTIPYQPLTGGSRPFSLGWVPCLCRCRRASPASPPDPGH